ncbi:divergent polysaccharide deacetylase family protein [Paramaledivibacter caminithermalis]|jgi:polysaccharide deacetylase 2 family uncharacterized protein YibQ|uniref:Divergent polysaccharide deacetylase n=1 Tax=Paramaledivibacter caminithermalis (strain DSM 15212 / CIP 107654 / DViRD3) TaxID=1121301 RepID=A0A1M6P8D9_PARC5|nr:divergent polysaccharide deacetylase family protein [Paramaledivibacter caminithermalis]SHK04185.1 hypothetical protein SAMN02745912_02049 [Paramaledivibacter caminithermalis DSM 15212]
MWIIVTRKRLFSLILIILSISILLVTLQVLFKHSTIVSTDSNSNGYVILIIDDFGNHGDGTDEMIDLNIPITTAIMPFMPHSLSDAKAAHNANLEVILHLPMEPNVGKKEWLGPRGITCNLSDEDIKKIVYDGLNEVKYAVGINNHMGSKATQDKRVMKAILEVAKENNLFFVDSKTSPASVVLEMANNLNVPCFTRDVFLDGTKDINHISKQILRLGDIALKKGYAIGIGHVGVEGGKPTAKAIKSVYPSLVEKGVRFITITQLMEILQD